MVAPRSQHIRQGNAPDTGSDAFVALHLARGGPFYRMQRKLRFLNDADLKIWSRAAIFSAAAWFVPLLLTVPIISGSKFATYSYLIDPGPASRFLIAIVCFIIAERTVEREVDYELVQLDEVILSNDEARQGRKKAVASAVRQRNSVVAEAICLLFALSAGVFAVMSYKHTATLSWAAQPGVNGTTLTPGGWWCVLVSIPLFSFLFLRGLWRHFILVLLLHRLARLKLRLVVTHPDGKAGLAFLGKYPNAFGAFVFGISSAVSAALWRHLSDSSVSAAILTTVMGGWLLLVFVHFATGLIAFSKPLSDAKKASTKRFSTETLMFQREAERKALGENIVANDSDEYPPDVAVSDMTKNYEQARKLSTYLIDRSILLPMAASALLPFSVVGFAHLPLKEVMSVLKKLLLL